MINSHHHCRPAVVIGLLVMMKLINMMLITLVIYFSINDGTKYSDY